MHVPRLLRLTLLAAAVIGLPSGAGAVISNGGFESGLTGWTAAGDDSVQAGAFGTAPTEGANQILVTTINDGVSSSNEPTTFSGVSALSDSALATSLGLPTDFFDNLSPSGRHATEGSAVSQTFTANAGDLLQFDWNFLTDANVANHFDDFAVLYVAERNPPGPDVVVSSSVLVNVAAASFQPSGTAFAEETGYQTTSVTLPVTGSYIFAIAVIDVQNQVVASGLALDNVQLNPAVPEPQAALLLSVGLLGLLWFGRRRPAGPVSSRDRRASR